MSPIPAVGGFLAVALCLSAQQQASRRPVPSTDDVPFDNVAGRLVSFPITPIHPMEFSADGATLYALNQIGARLDLLDPASLQRTAQVPIGLGAVSVMRRPGTSELWVVDSVESSVAVVDTALPAVVRTIRVGAEPHGIAFTDDGDRAYVTCSAAERVDVIDASTYLVAKSIPIPAEAPRGIVYRNGRAYVVSFLSGNGTAPRGTPADPNDVESIGRPAAPNENPLPDRDLFVIRTRPSIENDDLDPSATVSGLGTVLFNVHARPGTSELWIPNTEALNADHRGHVNFVAGQFVSNRITIVDATGATPPRIVDLDAIAPADRKCAQPGYVEFDPVEPLAYVAGYGNDLVAVLRLSPGSAPTWEGAIDLPSQAAYPRGTGPRAVLVAPGRTALVTYNRNDSSASRIPIASLPSGAGWVVTAPDAVSLGVDLSSGFVRLGRHLFSNARFSASQTTSCASCHVDGHTDGVAWDLSSYLDPEGTPDDQLRFPLDVKGPLVTQSVRRMIDASPYHWRGEIKSTNGFSNAFIDLFEHTSNGVPDSIGPDFQYLRRYMDVIAHPANPRQPEGRRLSGEALMGKHLFRDLPVQGSLTCASCHMLPTGSSGEIVSESVGGVITAADVPSLRGVLDRVSPRFDVGGVYGVRTETGAGLTHAGAIPSVVEAFDRSIVGLSGSHEFALAPQTTARLEAFLASFDTGIAPLASRMVTANAANWSQVAQTELPKLRAAAAAGDCDLVYYRVARVVLGQTTELNGSFDPATGLYRVASRTMPPIDEATLLAEAAGGLPVTFLGVPVGMGESQGLDRDMDGLFDLDEVAAGTDVESWDSDTDGFPDGYEVRWGTDPLQGGAAPSDTQAPALAGPVRLLYATTSTLKFEFRTNEYAKVAISYNGLPPVARTPFNQVGDHHHWVTIGELEPDTEYRISLEMRDPKANVAVDSSTVFRTRPRATPNPARIRTIDLSVGSMPGGMPALHSEVQVYDSVNHVGAGYRVVANAYWLRDDGTLHMLEEGAEALTGGNGVATFDVRIPAAGPSPETLYFAVQQIVPPPGAAPWARGLDRETVETLEH